MILETTFTKEQILNFKTQKENSRINPPILEKGVHALILLEQLSLSGLKFVFKGGTCLVLLLPKFKRLSIDIDIITQHSKEEIETVCEKIVAQSHFIRFELQEHRSYTGGVPKAHYAFYFTSHFGLPEEKILLDILFEETVYPETIEIPIVSDWLIMDSSSYQKVVVPTIDSILGDKLTAYAPNTTGKPYRVGKSIEIIKQLFDIGALFDKMMNVETVAQSFKSMVETEIGYRGKNHTVDDVLNDIIETGLLIVKREKNRGEVDIEKFEELKMGIKKIKGYLVSNSYRIENVIEAAGKAAYLAAKIKLEDYSPVSEFDASYKVNFILHKDYNFLNKLKKQNDNSFNYWYATLDLLNLVKE